MTVSPKRLESIQRRVPPARRSTRRDEPLNIIHFATAVEFLGKFLFPRQATLLKVMTLALELLTPFDKRVIEEWTAGFTVTDPGGEAAWSGTEGTPGDLMRRMAIARSQGHRWFRDILLLIGRRGSKGYLSAIFGAWVIWWLLEHDDPQVALGIDPDKRITIVVFAGNKAQAAGQQFRDLKAAILGGACFLRYHPHATKEGLVLFTQQQIDAGVDVNNPDLALIEIRASETTTLGARGPAVIGLFMDEFAHLVGAGSTASSTEIYESAVPATEQFGTDSVCVQTTSPWDRKGQSWITYQRACAIDPDTGEPAEPTLLMVQLPSWALYEDWGEAQNIEMWPGGPAFQQALKPIIEYNDRLKREEAANPDSFAVEYRAQWRSSLDAYLSSLFVDRVFAPFNGGRLVMQRKGILKRVYVAHGDPSLSQNNFGFAVAHLEEDEGGIPHVVFDLICHWAPADFPAGVVDYHQIEEEIFDLIKAFGIQTLTFDTWNSAEAIQRLQARAAQASLPRRPHIFQRHPTAELNWKVAEIFKTAIGHDLIHAPHYPLAEAELRGLELRNGKVCAPAAGDVLTKDVADAMMWTVYTLIGERAQAIFDQLASIPIRAVPAPPAPNPGAIGPDEDVFRQLSAAGRRPRFGPGAPRGVYYDPARSPYRPRRGMRGGGYR